MSINLSNDCHSTSREYYRTRYVSEKYLFTWVIENFCSYCALPESVLKSDTFPREKQFKCAWHLLLKTTNDSYVYCYLYLNEPNIKLVSNVTVSLLCSGALIAKQDFSGYFDIANYNYRLFQFNKQEVKKELKDDGALTVNVEIIVRVSTVSAFEEVFKAKEHDSTENLTNDFLSLYTDPKHSDVTILVKGKEIKAHCNILAARSKVFAAMFEHATAEKSSGKVEIKDFTFDTMNEMLRFMYTGMPPEKLDTPLAMNLLKAACKYDIESLKNICAEYLVSCLNTSDVEDVLLVADMYNVDKLREAATEFVFANSASFHFQAQRCYAGEDGTDCIVLKKKHS